MRLKKQRFFKRLKSNRTSQNKAKFDALDKEYNKLIVRKKKQFNHERFDKFKANSKRKWSIINDLLGRKKKENSLQSIYVDGVLSNDNQRIADGFNTFFSKIPEMCHDKLPHMDQTERLKKCEEFLKTRKESKFMPKKHTNSRFVRPTCPDEIMNI